jgi:hypothetical protein
LTFSPTSSFLPLVKLEAINDQYCHNGTPGALSKN